MKKFLIGGAVAALAASSPAFAQANKAAAPAAQNAPRHMLARNETRAELQAGVAKMFARLDTNHDGWLTKAEVDAQAAQRSAKLEQRAEKMDPTAMFNRLDANKDGKITVAEMDAVRAQRAAAKGQKAPPAGSGKANALFARADTNHDGVVTRAEFDAAIGQVRARMEHAGTRNGFADKLIETADSNKDGRVSLAEAQAMALQYFNRADTNKDGTVTVQERQQARQAIKPQR